PVNDNSGHDIGDMLLQAFALRIGALVRETDTFSRRGGDEFTLLLENIQSADDVKRIAAMIVEAAHQPFDLGLKKIEISASLGVTNCRGIKIDPELLLKQADAALYKAKEAGRNGFRLYTPD